MLSLASEYFDYLPQDQCKLLIGKFRVVDLGLEEGVDDIVDDIEPKFKGVQASDGLFCVDID